MYLDEPVTCIDCGWIGTRGQLDSDTTDRAEITEAVVADLSCGYDVDDDLKLIIGFVFDMARIKYCPECSSKWIKPHIKSDDKVSF